MTARRFVHMNYHATLGRIGGRVGAQLQATGWAKVQERAAYWADTRGWWTFLTTDDNDHGKAKPHPRARLLAGQGLDKVWGISPKVRPSPRPIVDVVSQRVVDLTIDGHNAPAAQVRITWPTGRPTLLWIVQANLGRGVNTADFMDNARRLRTTFQGRALIGLDEIDEADAPDEHAGIRDVFPLADRHDIAGWGTLVPTIVPPQLTLRRTVITHANNGMAKVTPVRVITESVLDA